MGWILLEAHLFVHAPWARCLPSRCDCQGRGGRRRGATAARPRGCDSTDRADSTPAAGEVRESGQLPVAKIQPLRASWLSRGMPPPLGPTNDRLASLRTCRKAPDRRGCARKPGWSAMDARLWLNRYGRLAGFGITGLNSAPSTQRTSLPGSAGRPHHTASPGHRACRS